MSTDTIAVSGLIATDPRTNTTAEGLNITSFRLASSSRRFDTRKKEWVDGETNWFTVTAFRNLAVHAGQSLFKGQRVLVQGRLRITPWENENRSGLNVEIIADGIGHDLAWGTSAFTKRERPATPQASADRTVSSPREEDGQSTSPGTDAAAQQRTMQGGERSHEESTPASLADAPVSDREGSDREGGVWNEPASSSPGWDQNRTTVGAPF